MPISVRTERDPEGGNKVTLTRFEIPVGISDPVERMAVIDELCGRLRTDRAIPYSNAIAGALNLLPITVTGGMLKHVDFLASNVPGFERGRLRRPAPVSRRSTHSGPRSGRPPTSR